MQTKLTPVGSLDVFIQFTPEGSTKLADVTEKLVGQTMSIALDDTVLTAPVIHEAIVGGEARINLGEEASAGDAAALGRRLRASVGPPLVLEDIHVIQAPHEKLRRPLFLSVVILAALGGLLQLIVRHPAPVLAAVGCGGILACLAVLTLEGGVTTAPAFGGAALVALGPSVAAGIAARRPRESFWDAVAAGWPGWVIYAAVGLVVAFDHTAGPSRGLASAVAVGFLPAGILGVLGAHSQIGTTSPT